ncbi:hypothetical protein AAFC00_002494 [Neodothiora populina]|uniref:C2 NT-type domain-containing protein n=1 Tax=Neodothiora populina TaxID=2781224 RepID=A0ABR3P7E9_9PEZI
MSMPKPSQVLRAHALTLSNIQVPKARRPRFELTLRVIDLNNVPLVSGCCFVKWHLPASTAAEHRGRTGKCAIKDHKVDFGYENIIPVRLLVGKDQMLQESWINFEVLQEYSSGGKGERLNLGNIKLNLAEYVDASEQSQGSEEEGVTRRYLMQDSKINSTLKVGIYMKHIEGDHNYYAPPLKTAPVFGGITGVMAQEAPDGIDDIGHMPSLSSKSRDAGEMQDMYRRNLAASWVAQPGELKADDCIEDIFSGGDGWGSHLHDKDKQAHASAEDADDQTSTHSAHLAPDDHQRHPRSKSPTRSSTNSHQRHHSYHKSTDSKHSTSGYGGGDWSTPHAGGLGKHGIFSGRTSLHQQARRVELENMMKNKNKTKSSNEVDEFDNPYRDDLRGWRVNVDTMA